MFTDPDVYHVGVATSPIPDPSTAGDLHEIYLGLPEYNNEAFKEADNTPKAANLKGKLLVVHGTGDAGCRTGLQMQLAEALIRAGKFFDLIMLPERGHGLTYGELLIDSPPTEFMKERLYTIEATKRYFVEHLKPDK
jgi:dipeptidyl-peptidase-4